MNKNTNRQRQTVPTMSHRHVWIAVRSGHGTETVECDTCRLRRTYEV